MIKKLAVLAATTTIAIPAIVLAVAAPKVFVCKYIGTPGVDERLQTGQNPISVSSNAIKDYKGVGSYFNDAQGRSYVLAEDYGQPEPDVSQCPTVTVTPQPTPVPSPSPTPPSATPTTPQTLSATTQSNATNDTPNFTGFQGK